MALRAEAFGSFSTNAAELQRSLVPEVTGPLCPELYAKLQYYFGDVQIANQGEEILGAWSIDPTTHRPRFAVESWGETYRVSCPFCGDTRQRLWVPYAYAMEDPLNPGFRNTHFGTCYNENCLDDPVKRRALADKLVGFVNAANRQAFVVRPGKPAPTTAGPRNLPGPCTPIAELNEDHPARVYLQSRHFGPDTWQRFGLAVCGDVVYEEYADYWTLLPGRIVIPVMFGGIVVGWQARVVGSPRHKGEPKYMTCPGMPRRLCLYNYDSARMSPQLVVVVEGPTDTWTMPGYAVALLGKTMTPRQQQLLLERWGEAAIGIMLDPDAAEAAVVQMQRLSASRPGLRVFCVTLPADVDPGDLTPEQAWSAVYWSASAAGINLQ